MKRTLWIGAIVAAALALLARAGLGPRRLAPAILDAGWPLLLLAAGFLLFRRLTASDPHRRTLTERWSVRVTALLVGLMGVVNVISALSRPLPSRLAVMRQWSPLEVRHGGHLTAALAGFALLLLAGNLWRRKRVAWLMALATLAISAASHLVKGLDYEEASLAAALAVWLLVLRPHFHARSDPPSVRQGLGVLAGALAFTLAYGTAGFYLLDRAFSVHFGLGQALAQTVVMFTQFYDPGLVPLTGFGRYFADSIYVVGAVTLGYAFLMLARPVLVRRPASAGERLRAGTIIQAHGRSSLARLTLLDDKSYFFTPGGSVVAYVARGRAAVALGDPLGPEQDAAAAIAEFKDFCARNDWLPSFYQVGPDWLHLYGSAGLDNLCIGHEGIVDLIGFSLEGGAGKPLRTACNRINRLGQRAELHSPPLGDPLLEELHSISDEWLARVHGSEMRFSVGWFDDDYLRSCPVMAVHTSEGWITAFASVLPEYRRPEMAVDLMRRRSQVEPGTMEFLFVALLRWAREQGCQTFSLGLSALSGVGERPGDPAVERMLRYVYEQANGFYSFKGVHAFKEKFHPHWSPRYLIYPGPAALPTVLAALVRAEAGDGALLGYLRRGGSLRRVPVAA